MRKHTRTRLAGLALLAAVTAMLIGSASAFAQDPLANPSASQYDPKSQVEGATTKGDSGPGGSAAAESNDSSGLNGNVGSLPFTGADLIVLVMVAVALTGTGIALRRLSTPRTPQT